VNRQRGVARAFSWEKVPGGKRLRKKARTSGWVRLEKRSASTKTGVGMTV